MKEHLYAGLDLEGRPVRAGKATNAIHPEYMAEQPGWGALQEGKGSPGKGMQQHWEAQWQEFLKTLQPIHSKWETPVIAESAPWEDAKAFLASFEQVAKACRWPREEWAARLLPALSGEAEQAFQTLETKDKEDYEKVKAAILQGDALRMELQRQHFREFCCPDVEDPRRIHSQVQELCHRWLKPERRSKEQILELLILEQFLASLPTDLQNWIRAGGPDSCSQAVALVEDFMTSQQKDDRGTWQGPMKEEGLSSQNAEEEPSDTVRGELCKQAKQSSDSRSNVLRSAFKCSSQGSSSLSPEEQRTVQNDVKEIDWQNLTQPSQQTIVWQVLQEDEGHVDSLGDRMEGQVKLENSQYGQNELEVISQATPQKNQGNVQGVCEERGKSKSYQRKHALKTAKEYVECREGLTNTVNHPSKEYSKEEMLLFSICDRRSHYGPDADMMHTREDCAEQFMSGGIIQQYSYSDRHQEIVTRDNKSQLTERGNKGNLDRLQSAYREGKLQNIPESGKNFCYTTSLPRNQGTESEGRPFECSFCRKCFSQQEHLTNHQQLHTGEKLHECPECGKIFTSRQALRRHQGIHTLAKPYKCSQCGKCFSQRRNLTIHQRIHTGEKPYKCPECGKKFSRTQCLKNHQRIHTGDKPHKCSQCGKCFNQRRYLKNHQRIHTGLKPYECSQCGKCFSMAEYLRNHQRIHTGVKPFQCSHCGKSYIQKVALISHQRIHTAENSKKNIASIGDASVRGDS
ncbi:zinc finger protein with KRAB and SCAN domains 8-like isoform X2 [Sceloporus undulatus]|uniref:zinc finger protein with KRAB and SCAN domains 8-like isoform X2 n=1 Tax=Sceloporus undulatus TaxID=8520 RepID=UPI001C4A9E68|nr:zinc finger protein with KRAB and SCAN domains 8-like isoform X2 [Sceloporus undulatus]